jgi:hypothetical protein
MYPYTSIYTKTVKLGEEDFAADADEIVDDDEGIQDDDDGEGGQGGGLGMDFEGLKIEGVSCMKGREEEIYLYKADRTIRLLPIEYTIYLI